MTNLSDIAVGYALQGYAVLPLRENKSPLIRHGSTEASSDAVVVAGWWKRWPTALVGLRTGAGMVVVDVDVQHGGLLDASWPLTLTARTRSGGWHLYYACARPVPNSVSKVAPGVDIRGDGGYVVAPGNPGWEWVDAGAGVQPLPESIRVLATSREATQRVAFTPAEAVSEGGRNDYIARFTGWAITHEVVDEDQILALVLQHNDDVCQPPLPDGEVRRTVRSIEQRHACRT